eukprot:7385994-Prymnesium_polylepis.1
MKRAVGGQRGDDEDGGGQTVVDEQMAALRRQLDEYATECSMDAELAKAPLEDFKGACVLLTTSVAVSKKVKDNCKALEALLDGLVVGYTVVDGAVPARARARNALWAVFGKAIGSSVLKKDYPRCSSTTSISVGTSRSRT